jgi:hypothetical protein
MNQPMPVHTIGGYVPMVDGPEKVSGRAKYTADILGACPSNRNFASLEKWNSNGPFLAAAAWKTSGRNEVCCGIEFQPETAIGNTRTGS